MPADTENNATLALELRMLADVLATCTRLPSDRNPPLVYLGRLAPGSRRAMRQALDLVASILNGRRCACDQLAWHNVRYQHVAFVRQVLASRYAPAMSNKVLSAVRGVLKEAWRLGLLSGDDYKKAVDVQGVKASPLPAGRGLGAGELRTLFETCARDEGAAGARDAALIAVLYGAGLRRSEAVNLLVSDYDTENGALTVRSGKGRKDRVGYATNGSRDAIESWLAVRGDVPGPLFCPVNKGSRITLRRMTDQAILYILRRRARQAGVARFSPHDLRRSFVSDLLDAGADISTVQRLAGHANISTTARYDRRGEATKKKAAEMLHVPYVGKKR